MGNTFSLVNRQLGCENILMKNAEKPTCVADRGLEIYERMLRSILEPAHLGEYVVIDPQTGEYELDPDHMNALMRMKARRPGVIFFATRVGSRTIARVGGQFAGKGQ